MFFIAGEEKGGLKLADANDQQGKITIGKMRGYKRIFVCVRAYIFVHVTALSLTRALHTAGPHTSSSLVSVNIWPPFCWINQIQVRWLQANRKSLIWYKFRLFKLVSISWCTNFLPTEQPYVVAWHCSSITRSCKARFAVFLDCRRIWSMMPGLRVGAESPTIPPKYHLVQYVCIYLIQLGGCAAQCLVHNRTQPASGADR